MDTHLEATACVLPPLTSLDDEEPVRCFVEEEPVDDAPRALPPLDNRALPVASSPLILDVPRGASRWDPGPNSGYPPQRLASVIATSRVSSPLSARGADARAVAGGERNSLPSTAGPSPREDVERFFGTAAAPPAPLLGLPSPPGCSDGGDAGAEDAAQRCALPSPPGDVGGDRGSGPVEVLLTSRALEDRLAAASIRPPIAPALRRRDAMPAPATATDCAPAPLPRKVTFDLEPATASPGLAPLPGPDMPDLRAVYEDQDLHRAFTCALPRTRVSALYAEEPLFAAFEKVDGAEGVFWALYRPRPEVHLDDLHRFPLPVSELDEATRQTVVAASPRWVPLALGPARSWMDHQAYQRLIVSRLEAQGYCVVRGLARVPPAAVAALRAAADWGGSKAQRNGAATVRNAPPPPGHHQSPAPRGCLALVGYIDRAFAYLSALLPKPVLPGPAVVLRSDAGSLAQPCGDAWHRSVAHQLAPPTESFRVLFALDEPCALQVRLADGTLRRVACVPGELLLLSRGLTCAEPSPGDREPSYRMYVPAREGRPGAKRGASPSDAEPRARRGVCRLPVA